MGFVIRAASTKDIESLYRMAKGTGGGFTNLPPDRPTLLAKLERAEQAFARAEDTLEDELFMFILENSDTGRAAGTCLIFSKIGSEWPFYNYRIGSISQTSKALNKTFRAELLTLCTDLEGTSEVGGLFLDPAERSAGVGKLLARSRYLFIGTHRSRFADRTIAELRGAIDDAGNSPFWDGLAGRFFDMSFREADDFNAIHGNQFIADLMPKSPIYTALLPESARAVMGKPHQSGRPAMRMLEKEGFAWENYIDIFDGGPAMTVQTDRIRTIRDSQGARVTGIEDREDGELALIAVGTLADYRCCIGLVGGGESGVTINSEAADLLSIAAGDTVTWAPA